MLVRRKDNGAAMGTEKGFGSMETLVEEARVQTDAGETEAPGLRSGMKDEGGDGEEDEDHNDVKDEGSHELVGCAASLYCYIRFFFRPRRGKGDLRILVCEQVAKRQLSRSRCSSLGWKW